MITVSAGTINHSGIFVVLSKESENDIAAVGCGLGGF